MMCVSSDDDYSNIAPKLKVYDLISYFLMRPMEEKYRGLKYKVGLKMYHHIALYSYVSVDDDNEVTISISYDGSFYLFAAEWV